LKYYHNDHLGSSVLVTDASGTCVHSAAYMPYGSDRPNVVSCGTFTPPYQFNFKEKEQDGTNFYDYGARVYNPPAGRWLSADTSTADGSNRYSYSRNSPLRYVDPTGHQSKPATEPSFDEWILNQVGRNGKPLAQADKDGHLVQIGDLRRWTTAQRKYWHDHFGHSSGPEGTSRKDVSLGPAIKFFNQQNGHIEIPKTISFPQLSLLVGAILERSKVEYKRGWGERAYRPLDEAPFSKLATILLGSTTVTSWIEAGGTVPRAWANKEG